VQPHNTPHVSAGVRASHICTHCGYELARVRATQDTYYGIPIVSCPRCSRVVVRTKHPDEVFWRQNKGLAFACLWLVIRSGVLVASGFLMIMSTLTYLNILIDGITMPGLSASYASMTYEELATTIFFLVLPVIAGVLIRVVLSHRSFLCSMIVAASLSLGWFGFYEAWMTIETLTGPSQLSTKNHDLNSFLAGAPLFAILSYLVTLVLSVVGLCVGWLIVKQSARWNSVHWRRKRRKLRRRQLRLAQGG
jgi:DNA-directed RNA polymerase subunit RPC12/RpoP